MTYDEAIQTAKQRLRIWDGYGGNDTSESVIDQANGVADALRALIAGPPEPTDDEAMKEIEALAWELRRQENFIGLPIESLQQSFEAAKFAVQALIPRRRTSPTEKD